MKNSNKFILIVMGVIAALLIIMTIVFRTMVSDHLVLNEGGESYRFGSKTGEIISDEFSYKDFENIKIAGGWDVLIVADDNYRIAVDYNERVRDELMIEKKGDTLYMIIDMKKRGNLSDFHGATATIYMPEVSSIEVDGAVNLNVENFKGGELVFNLDGAGQIVGENCSFEWLSIESNGAVNVDFYNSDTTNADVNIDGAGNVMLHMSGGELSGLLSGLAHLEYSGTVSLMTVKEDGIANVEYKKNAGDRHNDNRDD